MSEPTNAELIKAVRGYYKGDPEHRGLHDEYVIRLADRLEAAEAKIATLIECWPEFVEGRYSLQGSIFREDGVWSYCTEGGDVGPYNTKAEAVVAWIEFQRRWPSLPATEATPEPASVEAWDAWLVRNPRGEWGPFIFRDEVTAWSSVSVALSFGIERAKWDGYRVVRVRVAVVGDGEGGR